MQIDMHYYGTWVLARTAGLSRDCATMIASCAQFVDDNTAATNIEFKDGAAVYSEPTAHDWWAPEVWDHEKQRRVWVPFHFLPGNIGDSYTERLKCRKDSKIARQMVANHLSMAGRTWSTALIGITAHVYADTFAHYGFSGVSSRGNVIEPTSLMTTQTGNQSWLASLRSKIEASYNGIFSGILNISSLASKTEICIPGHGAVKSCPDIAPLEWEFEYRRADAIFGTRHRRSNPDTFFEASERLHDMFERFASLHPDKADPAAHHEFGEIAPKVRTILETPGDEQVRSAAWQDLADKGKGTRLREKIPAYAGQNWNAEWQQFDDRKDSKAVFDHPVWQFYQAAAWHRIWVLRDLLPSHGLVVG